MTNTSKTDKKHPYAEILIAIAECKEIQFQDSSGKWNAQDTGLILDEIASAVFSPIRYRVKPSMININGYEVPEPMRVEPEIGTVYYIVVFSDSGTYFADWQGGSYEKYWLKLGLCHSTKEAAELHMKALLSFSTAVTDTTK